MSKILLGEKILFIIAKSVFSVLATIGGLYMAITHRDTAISLVSLTLGLALANSARIDLMEEKFKRG